MYQKQILLGEWNKTGEASTTIKNFLLLDMERTTLHLLVVLLAFSHFIGLEAVPFARIRSLLEGPRDMLVPINTNQVTVAEGTLEELLMEGRMDLETNDYKLGPNEYHTPKPSGGRSR